MADIAWSDVTAIASQLAVVGAVPVAGQTLCVALANGSFDPAYYGGEDNIVYRMARILYAAHFAEIVRRQGQSGVVTSETFASQSVTVAYQSKLLLEPLQATPYGEQLMLLQSQRPNRAGFVA